MGGKGRRRREKNYKAAHGGDDRLPPPPKFSSIDAVPSKLRKLMSFAGGSAKEGANRLKTNTGRGDDKESISGEASNSAVTGAKRKRSDQNSILSIKNSVEVSKIDNPEKKKKKRKNSNKADDLRFETVGERAAGSQRKERKKQRLEERKKKRKNASMEDDLEFRDREQIKFGEVVQAPPKLTAVPKAFKATLDASQERLRLQAVEAYRKRKGWASRPGVHLPPAVTTEPPL